jgi:hypothetical protein
MSNTIPSSSGPPLATLTSSPMRICSINEAYCARAGARQRARLGGSPDAERAAAARPDGPVLTAGRHNVTKLPPARRLVHIVVV